MGKEACNVTVRVAQFQGIVLLNGETKPEVDKPRNGKYEKKIASTKGLQLHFKSYY